ncbi:isoleucine--tRNA ligase [Candidatus Woesearchaeota archaeon]|nr:isoleucine--tRNA ligase [Candidatus Woesearchaeota archaeon]
MHDFKKVEEEVLAFWEEKKIYEKAKKKTAKGKKFYYLDGPPYTTGAIHIGHAWGKSLRDMYLRILRMKGFNVWDQPGFDMHGLPIEVQVEKKLGIKDKHEIVNKFGMERFIQECEQFAVDQMHPMIKDFKRIGVWLDWKNPYMTIKNEYIEGAWWALKEADKNGYLAKGKKAMTWCPRCATALAKHELDYSNRKEESIFVKFKVKGKNEYLIIWTTTPWTIPFNLGIMVNPDLDYVRADVEGEVWILAKALAGVVIQAVAQRRYHIAEELKGEALEGLEYEHPFFVDVGGNEETRNACRVVLSSEYVSTDAGSGLVHCAPGCGPEDFEVGKRNGLKPFNEVDEHGVFSPKMGALKGLRAKTDDKKFTELLEKKGSLIAVTDVEHEYAHCWRCKTPVIFRTTDQWFLEVEKLKIQMRDENKRIQWQPSWAGNRWFDSWLKELQSWCISRQRFWGIPLPIWECPGCGKYRVFASADALKKECKGVPENLHKPWIDTVEIPCSCGKVMKRVPDVLDVWLDSGAAPWATLGFPKNKKLFSELFPMDLILEGSDQVRGWFNSLMCLSMVSHQVPPYKAVYMHGMIQDAQGRKMSKSLKNTISPYEVIEQYGADTMRYYMISGANPGLNLNYNFDDLKVKFRNLGIFVNLVEYLLNYADLYGINPRELKNAKLDVEEKYMLSKLNSAKERLEQNLEKLELNEVPLAVEHVLLELSRTYVQFTREKMNTEDEKDAVVYTLYTVLMDLLRMSAPIAPFLAEHLYLRIAERFGLKEESVHLLDWPKVESRFIDYKLEKEFVILQEVLQSLLAAREKARIGVRWPLPQAAVVTPEPEIVDIVEKHSGLLMRYANVKEIVAKREAEGGAVEVTPNKAEIGKSFKADSPKVLAMLNDNVLRKVHKEGKAFVGEFELTLRHINVVEKLAENLVGTDFRGGNVYIDTKLTDTLEEEGYAREIMRRIQALRREQGLKKSDAIELSIVGDLNLHNWGKEIQTKVGAKALYFADKGFSVNVSEEIKGKQVRISIKRH